ncbi:MAG: CYTH domain-containing protein [Paludibacter sp.]|nr:CYTH domain-containing protein [Paludibacter sp.]
MNKEIERKFLIKSEYKDYIKKEYQIAQGYLSSVPERTVRIRIKQDKAYITIKGESSDNGLSRFEWEKEIPVSDAQILLKLCEVGVIEKTRYEIDFAGKTFEVDEFHGENEGLILAELELTDENESVNLPDWIGKEVTGDKRYYNSYISKNPFKYWH